MRASPPCRIGLGAAVLITAPQLASCSGAPSYVAFGAYFPAWLICLFAGVVGAVATRVVLGLLGLWRIVPLQLLVCLAAGVIVGGVLSWLWIGS